MHTKLHLDNCISPGLKTFNERRASVSAFTLVKAGAFRIRGQTQSQNSDFLIVKAGVGGFKGLTGRLFQLNSRIQTVVYELGKSESLVQQCRASNTRIEADSFREAESRVRATESTLRQTCFYFVPKVNSQTLRDVRLLVIRNAIRQANCNFRILY